MMEIERYIAPIRKWWWLLVVATFVAAASSFVATRQQTPMYQSRTTLIIGSTIEDPNPTSSQFTLAQQLAATYADIANRDPLREATKEALGLAWLPEYLARAVPNSQLIEITVTDTNPARAQAVANELANQLILQGPTSGTPENQERLAFISQQLDKIQIDIEETEAEIERLQEELADLTSARQISDTQGQIQALESKLADFQTNFANLLANTQQGAVNTLTVIEPANLPGNPINQNSTITIALASAVGLAMAAGAAYLLEFLDRSLKNPDEAERIFNKPVIGYISDIEEGDGELPYVAENPRSFVAEAFRSLRTNLEFAAVEKPIHTLFVTSAGPEAGKTSVAVNLAIIMAQGGKKVVLLDADLRRPNIHGFLGISNSEGLYDVYQNELNISDAVRIWDKKISVVTAGSPPPNPAELLGSKLTGEILENLKEMADIVIIDGPPFLVADASILASKVDGVLVIIRPGYTPKDAALSMAEQIQRVGARVVGVVLNRIPRGSAEYYGKYRYYSPQYTGHPYLSTDEAAPPTHANGRNTLPALLARLVRRPAASRSEVPAATSQPVTPADAERSRVRPGDTARLDPQALTAPPKALAVLRWQDNVGKRQKLVLREGDTILIGRDRINDVIIHNRHVSRRHAVITWRKDYFEIADLGSTNGTFVNGTSAEKPVPLESGATIKLFDVELMFEILRKHAKPEAEIKQEKSPEKE